ncbi:MAG: hypothetical protein AAGJ97_00210 [Planctomycetota bacterium]
MNERPRATVLMIGLRSDAVDYEKWPELDRSKLEAGFETIAADVEAAGHRPVWCLVDGGPSAASQVADAIDAESPDVVLIGAGVRADPEHFALFEELINVVHAAAPRARIAFNTNPFDSVEAIARRV